MAVVHGLEQRAEYPADGNEWRAEGERRFGPNVENWRFVCPSCGNEASGAEFKEAGAGPAAMYQECIGRYDTDTDCDWAAYGLFDFCQVHVGTTPVFRFGEPTSNSGGGR